VVECLTFCRVLNYPALCRSLPTSFSAKIAGENGKVEQKQPEALVATRVRCPLVYRSTVNIFLITVGWARSTKDGRLCSIPSQVILKIWKTVLATSPPSCFLSKLWAQGKACRAVPPLTCHQCVIHYESRRVAQTLGQAEIGAAGLRNTPNGIKSECSGIESINRWAHHSTAHQLVYV